MKKLITILRDLSFLNSEFNDDINFERRASNYMPTVITLNYPTEVSWIIFLLQKEHCLKRDSSSTEWIKSTFNVEFAPVLWGGISLQPAAQVYFLLNNSGIQYFWCSLLSTNWNAFEDIHLSYAYIFNVLFPEA